MSATPGSLYSTYNPVSSYSYDPKDTAAIIVTNGGNTTDSDGLLTAGLFNAQCMTRMARIALMPPKAMRCRPSETL